MSQRMRHRSSTAGARHRAPAAFLALVCAAAPVAAHGPIRREPVTVPPPGTYVAPAAPFDPAMFRPAPPSGAVATTGVQPIRQLAADATLVVQARAAGTEELDEGRLRVYHLRVERTLRGTADASVAVVEIRGASERPPLIADGATMIALLRPTPPLSYLTQHLPAGTFFGLSGGRDGLLPYTSDAEREAIETALTEGARIAGLGSDDERVAAARALAFHELASASPRLAADAVVELRHVDPLQALDPQEIDALGKTLRNRTVSAPTRIALIHLVADRGAKEALPAIAAADVDVPSVLDAVLSARAKLGAPAGRTELAPYLSSKDPAIRAAALHALSALGSGVGDLGRFATSDPDVDVRVAAIDALGQAQKPAAVPVLSQTFATRERVVQQASGRALLAIGGPAASNALIDLALKGDSNETRTYAALLLLVSSGKDSEPVRRLMASNPAPEVRLLVEHGLQWNHSHQQAE